VAPRCVFVRSWAQAGPNASARPLGRQSCQRSPGPDGADIAFLCQRAAMFCVKDAVSGNDANDVSITRHHFDTALRLMTAHAANATPEAPCLLLAG